MGGPEPQSKPMKPSETVDLTVARIDAAFDEATRRAGQGVDPRIERELDSLARRLCALLRGRARALVRDAIEFAKRVMDAADPEAPLLMLRLARENLMRELRRQVLAAPAAPAL